MDFMPENTMIDWRLERVHTSQATIKKKDHFPCAAYYRLGHYGHCFVHSAHYENYNHLAFGVSMLPLGPCYFVAQLNALYLIHSSEQHCLCP